MTLINWIAIGLSVVLWLIGQQIGAGVGMASSTPVKEGGREDVALDRIQAVQAIVALGALLTFITQLIDNSNVKTAGLITLLIALLALATYWSGLLFYRLPPPEAPEKKE